MECLHDIATIIGESDVSPFEIIHSGLVGHLLTYLTAPSHAQADDTQSYLHLRSFLHVFLRCPVSDRAAQHHSALQYWQYSTEKLFILLIEVVIYV